MSYCFPIGAKLSMERMFFLQITDIFMLVAGSAKRCRQHQQNWWSQTGSNRRHRACKARALPAELWPLTWCVGAPTCSQHIRTFPSPQLFRHRKNMVGLGRFELPTSRLSSARSNQLSYRPLKRVSVMKKEKRRRRHPALYCKELGRQNTSSVILIRGLKRTSRSRIA